MRTTKGCFGTPEAALQDVGVVELFQARLGGHAGVSGTGYIDATAPGLQAVYEKAAKAYIFSRCFGRQLRLGNPGLIDAGALYSPTQYVLELELNAGLARADWEVPVDDEHIALDDILAVGPGQKRNFLTTDHTLRHCREAWAPRLLDKGARALADSRDEEQLLQRADEHWREVVASHTPPAIDEDRRRAVWEAVERARRELVGGE
jgi:trimethylamine:corrinoid methyltransferase-like protein